VRSSRNSLLIDSLDCGCGQIELLLDLFDNRLQALNFTMPTIHRTSLVGDHEDWFSLS